LIIAYAKIGDRLLAIIFTEVASDLLRIISARPANQAEGNVMKKKTAKTEEPSKASLRAMPEFDMSKAKFVRHNPYAAGIRKAGGYTIAVDGKKPCFVRVGAGRPKQGQNVGPSSVRSIRLPDALWEELAARAAAHSVTLHAELRAAIAKHLRRTG
jgi:hypothetical protein